MIIIPHLRYSTRKARLKGEVSIAIVLEPCHSFWIKIFRYFLMILRELQSFTSNMITFRTNYALQIEVLSNQRQCENKRPIWKRALQISLETLSGFKISHQLAEAAL